MKYRLDGLVKIPTRLHTGACVNVVLLTYFLILEMGQVIIDIYIHSIASVSILSEQLRTVNGRT